MYIQRRAIRASEDPAMNLTDTQVSPEASDLLFEAEDVADLVAEITGEPVEVTADENEVTFAVGDEEYTATADGDEEILESVRRPMRNKKAVSASTRRPATRRPVSASTRRPAARNTQSVRRIPRGRN